MGARLQWPHVLANCSHGGGKGCLVVQTTLSYTWTTSCCVSYFALLLSRAPAYMLELFVRTLLPSFSFCTREMFSTWAICISCHSVLSAAHGPGLASNQQVIEMLCQTSRQLSGYVGVVTGGQCLRAKLE